MLEIILISQAADTVKENREEAFKFLAGQCILGCFAYAPSTFAWTLSITDGQNPDVAACVGLMTPLACLGISASQVLYTPMRKPIAIASFTGALDGMIWSSLLIANIGLHTNSEMSDKDDLYTTIFLLGLTGGNTLGFLSGLQGGSEGAYILKTALAVYMPIVYFQAKRLLIGKYFVSDNLDDFINELKLDVGIATALSTIGGLTTFSLTYNDYDITSGDALFISSNIAKGALILNAPVKTMYMLSTDNTFGFWGIYGGNPVFERLGSLADLTGMALGAYISYQIAKKKTNFSLLEGLIYSTVPALAFWAALGPRLVYEEYIKIAPMLQVTFDLGTSILMYGFLEKF